MALNINVVGEMENVSMYMSYKEKENNIWTFLAEGGSGLKSGSFYIWWDVTCIHEDY